VDKKDFKKTLPSERKSHWPKINSTFSHCKAAARPDMESHIPMSIMSDPCALVIWRTLMTLLQKPLRTAKRAKNAKEVQKTLKNIKLSHGLAQENISGFCFS